MRLEQNGAQRWAERKRHEAGNDRRSRYRDRELAEELARDAGNEGCGNEHGRQHNGNGDQGAADLVHRLVRGIARRQAALQISFDVLDDDDRIVDDNADRQHQTEQREIVERKSESRENGKRADQRNRNGDDRDHRSAPALQKKDHHQHDQDNGFPDRVDHRIDRLLYELGWIVDDVVLQSRRKAL